MLEVFFATFGLLIGSFLNALIYRLPRNINIAVPRSSCTSCQKVISWYENIPLISYIFLRGKCSGCKTKISWEYPTIELLAMVAAFYFAPSDLNPESLLKFFFFFSIFSAFLVQFIVDLKHQLLPDSVNLYLALLFFAISLVSFPWTHWMLGAALGLGFPLLVSWIFYQLKGEVGLGGGDIKLYGALGLYLGPVGVMQNIFLSCFLGALIGIILIFSKVIRKENPIPFGPFIIIVASFQIFASESFARLMSYIP